MKDSRVEMTDLDEKVRDFVAFCEVSGQRTIFTRSGAPTVVMAAWDEYLAMRETLALLGSEEIVAELALAEEQARAGKLLLPEDWDGQ